MYGSYGFTEATPEPLDWELLQLLVDDLSTGRGRPLR